MVLPRGVEVDFRMRAEVEMEACPADVRGRFINCALLTMRGCNHLEGSFDPEEETFDFTGTIAPIDYSTTYEREVGAESPLGSIPDHATIWFYHVAKEHNPIRAWNRAFLMGCQVVNVPALVSADKGVGLEAVHSCAPVGVRCQIVKPCSDACRARNQPLWEALETYTGMTKQVIEALGQISRCSSEGWKTTGGVLRTSFFISHDRAEAEVLKAGAKGKPKLELSVARLDEAMRAMDKSPIHVSVANYAAPVNEICEMQQKLVMSKLKQEKELGILQMRDELGEPFCNLMTRQQYAGCVVSFTDMDDIVTTRAVAMPIRKVLTDLWVAMRYKGYHTLTVQQLAQKKFTVDELLDLQKIRLNTQALNGVQTQYFSDYVPQSVSWHAPPSGEDCASFASRGLESRAVAHDGVMLCVGTGGSVSFHGQGKVIVSGAKADMLCVSPNGSILACAAGDTVTLHRLQYRSAIVGDPAATHKFGAPVTAMAFAWDGMSLACATGSGLHKAVVGGAPLQFSNVARLGSAPGEGEVHALAFSPCGNRLACGPDLSTLDLRQSTWERHGGTADAMAFTQDGGSLVSARASGRVISLSIARSGKLVEWGSIPLRVHTPAMQRLHFSTCGRSLAVLERDGDGSSLLSAYSLFPESCGPDVKFMYSDMKDGFIKTALAVTEDQRQLYTGPDCLSNGGYDDCETRSSSAKMYIKASEALHSAMRSGGSAFRVTKEACEEWCRKIPSLKGDASEPFVRSLAMHWIMQRRAPCEALFAIGSAGAANPDAESQGHLAGHCYATLRCVDESGRERRRLLESTCAADCKEELTAAEAAAINKLCAVAQMLTRTGTSVAADLDKMMSVASMGSDSFWQTIYVSGSKMIGTKPPAGGKVATYGASARDFVRNDPMIVGVEVNYQSAVDHLGGAVDGKCIKKLAVELCMVQQVPPWTRDQWDNLFYSSESMGRGLDPKTVSSEKGNQKFLFCHHFASEVEASKYCAHVSEPQNMYALMTNNLLDTKYHAALQGLSRVIEVEQAFHLGGRAVIMCRVDKRKMPQAVGLVDDIINIMHAPQQQQH